MYKPTYFELYELIDPEIYDSVGEDAWKLLDENALITLDKLRKKFGPIRVNDWMEGGRYKESGLRRKNSPTGARRSMHKYGKAFDCKFFHKSIQEVFEYIIENEHEFPELKRLEHFHATPTWLHFDVKETNQSGIYVFRP